MVCSKLLLRIHLFSLQNPGVSAKVPHCYSALREAPQIWCRLGARKANPCRRKEFAQNNWRAGELFGGRGAGALQCVFLSASQPHSYTESR